MNRIIFRYNFSQLIYSISKIELKLAVRSINRLTCFIFFQFLLASCEKFVETDKPANKITSAEAWGNNASAASVLTKVYSDLSSNQLISGNSGISCLSGLLSDELTLYTQDPNFALFYTNNLQSRNATFLFWSSFYNYIYTTNDACEQLPKSKGISDPMKRQLLGEAKFLRAFCYFYLCNYYGDVPLILSTDYQTNRLATRAPKLEVYKQIINDLKEAQELLNEEYLSADASTPSTERVRPNKYAATALLARAYLYTGDYKNAELQSSIIIENSKFELVLDLKEVFLANSREAIWQLQSVTPNRNTKDGDAFILIGSPDGQSPSAISQQLMAAFEGNDKRKETWVNSITNGASTYNFPYKYKVGRNVPEPQPRTENLIVLRLAEQYLIRAEARAYQDRITGGNSSLSDLNKIRGRAGLNELNITDKGHVLLAIEHERQVELFAEFGHRWMDLKRTGRIDAIMNVVSITKGGTWAAFKSLLPIPFESIQFAPGLKGKQNPGYQ